jgi:flagellar basal-body rod protein FlgB
MLFDSSTIPVLEQVVNFTQARHGVLAGNIANIDTPGYRTHDLSPERFQSALKKAIQTRDQPPALSYPYHDHLSGWPSASGQEVGTLGKEASGQIRMDDVKDSMKSILFHDNSNVSIEQQVTELTKNQFQHNLAISIMTSQFRLLRAAITERA